MKANIWNRYLASGVHAATVGAAQGDRCSCGPARQAGKKRSFNLPFNTPVNRAAVTERAQYAHYARLYTATGFGWVGKQLKARSRSPEILVGTAADKAETMAS